MRDGGRSMNPLVLFTKDGTPHLISNEEASAGFEAVLMFWVEKAKSLQTGHVH
jgi:hypothetical protein